YPRAQIAEAMAISGQAPQPGAPASTPAAPGAPGGIQGVTVSTQPPKPMSAEAAARSALVKEGMDAVETFKSAVIKNGAVDRGLVTSAWMNIPGTEGARLRNLLENAIGNR